ncbi:MAG: hypothetical protein EOP87_03095 [Verrucomicrobiaceae bacterium]|nr:MAG: hypothetical protein EOP87_03095 [Verrucomicrobiaceae bacterium]
MRRLLLRSAAAVAVILAVFALLPDSPVHHESSVPGPQFHARSTVEAAEVWSGLLHELEAKGFELEPPPAGEQPPAPVSGAVEEERRTRYSKTLQEIGTLTVRADLSGNLIVTSVEWEAWTRTGTPRVAKRLAASNALAIDDYFRSRMETNLVPKQERDRLNRDLWKKGKQSR